MHNQGKLLKIVIYLARLSFVKSLPWFVIETHGSKLSMSFYRNIVCKKYLVCIGPKGLGNGTQLMPSVGFPTKNYRL